MLCAAANIKLSQLYTAKVHVNPRNILDSFSKLYTSVRYISSPYTFYSILPLKTIQKFIVFNFASFF